MVKDLGYLCQGDLDIIIILKNHNILAEKRDRGLTADESLPIISLKATTVLKAVGDYRMQ